MRPRTMGIGKKFCNVLFLGRLFRVHLKSRMRYKCNRDARSTIMLADRMRQWHRKCVALLLYIYIPANKALHRIGWYLHSCRCHLCEFFQNVLGATHELSKFHVLINRIDTAECDHLPIHGVSAFCSHYEY